jgi:hypothetical protein
MRTVEEEAALKIRPRPSEAVTIEVPKETLEALRRVAESRDMSPQALIKFYVGQGLRHDLAEQFVDPASKPDPVDAAIDPPKTRRKARSR